MEQDMLVMLAIGGALAVFGGWTAYRQRFSFRFGNPEQREVERRSGESYREHREREERRENLTTLQLTGNAARLAGAGFLIGGAIVMINALIGGSTGLLIVGVLVAAILTLIGVGMQVVKVIQGVPDKINEFEDRASDFADQAREAADRAQQAQNDQTNP